jgi:iron complex outermembrane receptor protein
VKVSRLGCAPHRRDGQLLLRCFGRNCRRPALLCALLLGTAYPAQAQSVGDLGRLSIEELANIEITSVTRQPEPLSEAAASIYVITGDQIRRSGAGTLPEALRLAPNLEVSRVNSGSYAISARGFNSIDASNKLLVLIDGRSLYTPLHGGVFWDQQQVMPEDIDRIEVISGPGATLWGANAVNGVINIITKSANDTLGGIADASMGLERQRANARYGVKLGADAALRLYAEGSHFGSTERPDGHQAGDDWDALQTGFRLDGAEESGAYTVSGDLFRNRYTSAIKNSGGNVSALWTHRFDEAGTLKVQSYYDHVERTAPGAREDLDTINLDLQHSFEPWRGHRIVWGAGYRHDHEVFDADGSFFHLAKPDGTVDLGNVFLQDAIGLAANLDLTLGSKFEYSSFTGFEYLPSVHLAWQAAPSILLWGAVSRAVRTPSRIDRELEAQGLVRPARNFDSETLIAYELGYRGTPARDTTFSFSFYYNDYDGLRALSSQDGLFEFANVLEGHAYGLETWGSYSILPDWTLEAGANFMKKHLHLKPPGVMAALDQHVGNDPESQFFLRSTATLLPSLTLYLAMRYVDDLSLPATKDYVAVDARLGWQATRALRLALSASNLFGGHVESDSLNGEEIERNVELSASWSF